MPERRIDPVQRSFIAALLRRRAFRPELLPDRPIKSSGLKALLRKKSDRFEHVSPDRSRTSTATHKASVFMKKLCSYCKERPAEAGVLPWYTILLFFVFPGGGVSSNICADCAGGRNLQALLFLAAAAVVVFVVTVIIWGT